MNFPTPDEQREYIRKWAETGRILDEMRREKLRGMPYNWEEVDALLEVGDHCGLPSRTTSGMIEMQRLFMKLRPGTPGETTSGGTT